MLKTHPNSPAHLFVDDSPYFITGAIYQKRLLLASNEIKDFLLANIKECFTEKAWLLDHWVILDNHYHLLVTSKIGADLSGIISKIHMLSAKCIRAQVQAEKPIWWNYWDYCPRDEADYWIRLNYLLNNPVKHGYVKDLKDYPYSSFHEFLKKQGRELLVKQFREYPDKNLVLDEDEVLAMILDDNAAVMEILWKLFASTSFADKQVHDANIVSTLFNFGLDTLVTANTSDFAHFAPRLKLIDPRLEYQ